MSEDLFLALFFLRHPDIRSTHTPMYLPEYVANLTTGGVCGPASAVPCPAEGTDAIPVCSDHMARNVDTMTAAADHRQMPIRRATGLLPGLALPVPLPVSRLRSHRHGDSDGTGRTGRVVPR